jgi:hypothetical protein
MIKTTLKLALAVAIAGLLASSAYAAPLTLSAAQMDGVTAGSFVCPVLTTDAPFNNPSKAGTNPNSPAEGKFIEIAGGHYSILGPVVSVPMHATNNNGLGAPGGPHAAPGDSGYSPIWYTP